MSTTLKTAGSLQKGNAIVIDGVACIVSEVKISKPGKHGSSKSNITAVGMLDDKKRNIVMPGSDSVEVPIIDKKNAQVLSLSGSNAQVMDMETFESFDLKIAEELKSDLKEGDVVLYWIILGEKVMKQIKNS